MKATCTLLALLVVAGCTQGSKSDYHAAGQDLEHAAKETGNAMKKDVAVAGKAAQNAANAAKKTTENAEHKPDKK